MISPLNLGDGTKQRLTDDGEALQLNFPSLKLPGLDSPAKSRLRCRAATRHGLLHADRAPRLFPHLKHAMRAMEIAWMGFPSSHCCADGSYMLRSG